MIGSVITRSYKGAVLRVEVLEDGFGFAGKQFRSLSAVARHITGQIINGYAFFKLRAGKKK